MITRDQKAFFLENGYLHLPGVLRGEELTLRGSNQTDGLRCGVYLYYGYWWFKRYDAMDPGKYATPWQALEGASRERLELLGLKMPGKGLHMYDPRG